MENSVLLDSKHLQKSVLRELCKYEDLNMCYSNTKYGKGKPPTLGLIYQYPFFGDLMSISDEQFYLGYYKTAGKTKPFTLELKISP